MARFQPKHDPVALLAVVARVLRAARPHEPHRVTQREYDSVRAKLGHGDTPRADKVAARFGVSWTVLRKRALTSAHPARSLATAAQEQRRRVLTTAEAISAVQRAAAYLDTETMTTARYEEARLALQEIANRRHTHGRHLIPLPLAQTIARKYEFSAIVAAAGLRSPPKYVPPLLPRTDAVCVFVQLFGFLPRRTDLEWLGRAHGIQFVKASNDNIGPATQAARARFAAAGRWFPPDGTRGLVRPENWQRLGEGSAVLADLATRYPRKRTPGDGYTLQEIRDAITQAWAALPTGQSLTATRYTSLARSLGLPAFGTLHRIAKKHGSSFARLVQDEAEARTAPPGA